MLLKIMYTTRYCEKMLLKIMYRTRTHSYTKKY